MDRIGDRVTYRRRDYRVCGFDPCCVTPRQIYLEDLYTGEPLTLDLVDLLDFQDRERHLRLVANETASDGAETSAPGR
jgi:hypothetical protein